MASVARIIALSSLLLVAGCGGGLPLPTAPAPLLTGSVSNEPSVAEGPVVEVYSRIARGAMACWFAPGGALAKTHLFQADVNPPSVGGTSEIYVHERDRDGPKPWGNKVFRITLAPAGDQTALEVRNLKLPEPLAVQMRADVFQWATGGTGCKAGEGGTGLSPPDPPPEPPKKKKSKPAAKPKPKPAPVAALKPSVE